MKTDGYTKAVLTVIAFCLVVNLFSEMEFIPRAYASDTATGKNNHEYALVPLSEAGTIDVRIVDINTYDELNVNLKGVDTREEVSVNIKGIDTDDELDINLDEVGGFWVPNGGPIKVAID